jgi:hypothetical protein
LIFLTSQLIVIRLLFKIDRPSVFATNPNNPSVKPYNHRQPQHRACASSVPGLVLELSPKNLARVARQSLCATVPMNRIETPAPGMQISGTGFSETG